MGRVGLREHGEVWSPLKPDYINNLKLELIRKNSVLTACTLGESIDFSGEQLLDSPILPVRRSTLPLGRLATDLLPSMDLRDYPEELDDPFSTPLATQTDQFEFCGLDQEIRLD